MSTIDYTQTRVSLTDSTPSNVFRCPQAGNGNTGIAWFSDLTEGTDVVWVEGSALEAGPFVIIPPVAASLATAPTKIKYNCIIQIPLMPFMRFNNSTITATAKAGFVF